MAVNVVNYGEGRPLVLFHGWGFDTCVWRSLLPLLTHQYQLYLVDLPGFGLTPLMEWDLFKEALLNQLPRRFALVGWSMGGSFDQHCFFSSLYSRERLAGRRRENF